MQLLDHDWNTERTISKQIYQRLEYTCRTSLTKTITMIETETETTTATTIINTIT